MKKSLYYASSFAPELSEEFIGTEIQCDKFLAERFCKFYDKKFCERLADKLSVLACNDSSGMFKKMTFKDFLTKNKASLSRILRDFDSSKDIPPAFVVANFRSVEAALLVFNFLLNKIV